MLYQVILELTETSFLKNPEVLLTKLNKLSKKSLKIAIDDYGTGYSSLSYLKRLPVSILKIDQSFIADIGKKSDDTIIVKSTIKLAHRLGFKVIAEGVEVYAHVAGGGRSPWASPLSDIASFPESAFIKYKMMFGRITYFVN